MNTFEHFPKEAICPICGTNTDKECILIGIDGTQEGNNCQAIPVHLDCILESLMYYKDIHIIGCNTKEKEEDLVL